MSQVIVLDSAPVGLITNPKGAALSLQCQEWFSNLFDREYDVVLPEIMARNLKM